MDAFEKLMDVASYYNGIGNFGTSEKYYRGALDLLERTLGPTDPSLVDPMMRMALALSNQGKFDEAEMLLDRAEGLARDSFDSMAVPRLYLYRAMHLLQQRECQSAKDQLALGQAILTKFANLINIIIVY